MLVIPVYNMLLLPEANLYFQLDQLRKISGSRSITLNEKTIVILAKEKFDLSQIDEDSFYPIGVVGYVSALREGFVTITLQYRVNLENIFINPDRTIKLGISRRNEIQDLDEQTRRFGLNIDEKITSGKNYLKEVASHITDYKTS